MKRWTKEEVKSLKSLIESEKGFVEIAETLGRTRGEVTVKSQRLGLKSKFRVNVGENNGQWKGNEVKYGCLHKWVRRNKPQPESCEICGVRRDRLDCANISGDYKRELSDWIYLCRRCHMKTDGRLESWNFNRILEMKNGINVPRNGGRTDAKRAINGRFSN